MIGAHGLGSIVLASLSQGENDWQLAEPGDSLLSIALRPPPPLSALAFLPQVLLSAAPRSLFQLNPLLTTYFFSGGTRRAYHCRGCGQGDRKSRPLKVLSPRSSPFSGRSSFLVLFIILPQRFLLTAYLGPTQPTKTVTSRWLKCWCYLDTKHTLYVCAGFLCGARYYTSLNCCL